MRPYIANLKLYYQCPWMWFFHILGGLAVGIMPILKAVISQSPDDGRFVSFIVAAFFSAFISVSIIKDVLTKPFSFLLPGHNKRFVHLILGLATFTALICSPIFLAYPQLDLIPTLVACLVTFVLTMAIFLATSCIFFKLSNASGFWGLAILFQLDFMEGFRLVIQGGILNHPLPISCFAFVVALLSLRYLNSGKIARRHCGANYLMIHDSLNQQKVKRFNARKKQEKEASRKTSANNKSKNSLLVAGDRTSSFFKRYILADLYRGFQQHRNTSTKNIVLALIAISCLVIVAGYLPRSETDHKMSNLVYVLSMVLGGFWFGPLKTSISLPAGRKDRYALAMVQLLTSAAMCMAASVLILGFHQLLGFVAPNISLLGEEFVFDAVPPHYIPIALMALPTALGCSMLFPRYGTLVVGGLSGAGAGLIALNRSVDQIILLVWPGLILVILLWTTLFLIVRNICLKEDLPEIY